MRMSNFLDYSLSVLSETVCSPEGGKSSCQNVVKMCHVVCCAVRE
jgi:hypothetical protein